MYLPIRRGIRSGSACQNCQKKIQISNINHHFRINRIKDIVGVSVKVTLIHQLFVAAAETFSKSGLNRCAFVKFVYDSPVSKRT